MFNRQSAKICAKNIVKSSHPSMIIMGAIFTAISIVFNALSSRVLSTNMTEENMMRLYNASVKGNYESVMNMIEASSPSPFGKFLACLIMIVMWVVAAGFVIFIMNTIRKSEAVAYGNILDGFSFGGKIVLLMLVQYFLITLGTCLLVIPGIILSFAYRQALYILVDDPEKGIRQCLRESRMMMRGHKWELFVLDLSFIGWKLLSAITMLANIWVAPYTETVYFEYYEHVAGKNLAFSVV